MKKTKAYYNYRVRQKKKLLGYKREERYRNKDREKTLEEVEASLNNKPYIPPTVRKSRAEIDARFREKKKLLGYRWDENLRKEHKTRAFKLEEIRRGEGLDPSVPVPSVPSARP